MARLYSDLADGSGRRYYFSLASAPGGLQVGKATLTIGGFAPTIFEQVSVVRAPAPALLLIQGRTIQSDVLLSPAPAALSLVGQVAGEYRSLVVTNSADPVYTDLPEAPPSVLFINTVTPAQAVLTFNGPPINVTQGGNIGFVSVGVGLLSIQGNTPTLIFLEAGVGALSIQGLAPTLQLQLVIRAEDDSTALRMIPLRANGLAPTISRPFQWIDADPPPATSWTTTTGVAA